MPLCIYLIPFLTSLGLSLILTRWVRNQAVRWERVDPPRSGRHHHTTAVPRLGGIAIFLAFVGSTGLSLLAAGLVDRGPALSLRTILAVLGPGLMIFFLGFCDDLYELTANWKFGVQILAAVLLYANGVGVYRIGIAGHDEPVTISLGLPLTVFWVLLITNAFNLIDGLDGLAAGSATFSTIIIFAVSLLRANPLVSFLAIALAGAMLGFLRYNLNPASIFLGDSGSLLIGFMLSALALVGSQKATTMVAVAIPLISFGLPIVDVVLAVVRRLLRGKPLFRGDDDHIHHKLLKMGLSHRKAVLVLYAVTAGFGFISLVLLHGDSMIALVLCVVGCAVWVGVQQLHYAEFGELRSFVERAGQRRRVIINNLAIRHATESLMTCVTFDRLCHTLNEAFAPLGFDGCVLRSSRLDGIPPGILAPFQPTYDGRLSYGWSGHESSEPEWEIRIELTSALGEKWGQFCVYRRCCEDPILFDIHLLNGDFRRVLVEAIHRNLAHTQSTANETETQRAYLIDCLKGAPVSIDAD
jgi:UDP-GlcNAc:undecaprenyl-phosphate/decaprenyl-phosphate GlcNAc-1-phosphate transferase